MAQGKNEGSGRSKTIGGRHWAQELEELAGAGKRMLQAEIRKRMLVIPNIIDDSVPIGKDDSENVEVERFGEPVVPDFEVPYHVDIMERLGRDRPGQRQKNQRQRLLLSQGAISPGCIRRFCPTPGIS